MDAAGCLKKDAPAARAHADPSGRSGDGLADKFTDMDSTFTLSITSLSHDGRGIGFLPSAKSPRGHAVFVRGALPGQTVLCRAVHGKKNMLEAEVVEILDAGPNTQQPICAHSSQCGGCPLQTMPYAMQMRWKQSLALDSMSRIGRISREILDSVWQDACPSPVLEAFRNKIELAFGHTDSGEQALGFRVAHGHEVFNLTACGLVEAGANAIIADARQLAFADGLKSYENGRGFWRHLVLRKGYDDSLKPVWQAIFITARASRREKDLVRGYAEVLLKKHPTLSLAAHWERRDKTLLARGEKCVGQWDRNGDVDHAPLVMPLAGRKFVIDSLSFFQVNDQASQHLAQMVLSMDAMASRQGAFCSLLDVYCGCGAPGLLLADRYEKIFGVEADKCAVARARQNAGNRDSIVYEAGNADEILRRLAASSTAEAWTTALLDPPRAGLGAEVVESVLTLAPENIIYISCNPSTMARDAALLAGAYNLRALSGVDLFPHTPHLECCGLWTAKKC